MKFLIALTFWEGDKKHAMALAKLLADIEPSHSKAADFLLVNRFDCARDASIVPYLSRKFNVFQWTSTRKNVGWPDGCNDLWLSMMEWVWSMRNANRVPEYKAIFNCEADGAPICKDWIARMSAAWDEANKSKPVVMAGPLVQQPAEHINANALLTGKMDFLTWIARRMNLHARGGWDFTLAQQFKQMGWANIPTMRSYWNTPHFSAEEFKEMQDEKLIWVHGDKSGDLLRMGREQLL